MATSRTMEDCPTHEVAVDIGGMPILVRTDDAEFRALLERRYAGFLGPSANNPLALDVDIIRPDRQICEEEELEVWSEGGRWRLERGDFQAEWDPRSGRGRLAQDFSPYAIDCVLRIVHSLIQAQAGGFLLHSASAIRNGKAFLFSGVSGAGKTTISSLIPKDAVLLTDEISYIRRDGDEYRACGTPFAGELARLGENASAPITRLFFLAKGPEDRIDPIEMPDALRMLLRNILFFADDPELVKMVFRSACDFLARVPAFRLTFFPDSRVWAHALGIPLSVHIDVTYRCNERCVHCYLDHDDKGEMTTQEIKNVLDQLAEAGVFFWCSAAARFACAAIFWSWWSTRASCSSM